MPSTRLAIVDDNASVRRALKRVLQASYEVETFESASEFLASLNQRLPECLIVNLQMPGMDGLELRNSRARTGIDIPTIIITTNDEPRSRERCIAAGVAAYLVKPIQKAVLIAAIKAATKNTM